MNQIRPLKMCCIRRSFSWEELEDPRKMMCSTPQVVFYNLVGRNERSHMKLLESEAYEDLGAAFQYHWISLLKASLKKHGIAEDAAKEICGDFTFGLSMLLDQGEIDHDGSTYRPVIAFTPDEETFLIQNPDFEYHEYAFGNTSEAFDGK